MMLQKIVLVSGMTALLSACIAPSQRGFELNEMQKDESVTEMSCDWEAGDIGTGFALINDTEVGVSTLASLGFTGDGGATLTIPNLNHVEYEFLFCLSTTNVANLQKVVRNVDQLGEGSGVLWPVDGTNMDPLAAAILNGEHANVDAVLNDFFSQNVRFLVKGWKQPVSGESIMTVSRYHMSGSRLAALDGEVSVGRLVFKAEHNPPRPCEVQISQTLSAGDATLTLGYCIGSRIHDHGGPGYQLSLLKISDSLPAIPMTRRERTYSGAAGLPFFDVKNTHHHLKDSFVITTEDAIYEIAPVEGAPGTHQLKVKTPSGELRAVKEYECQYIYMCASGFAGF